MTQQEIDRIENAIRHIQTAADVDPWAAEIAVESMRKRITPTSVIVENGWMTKNDIAIHIINEIRNIIIKNDSWSEDATTAVNEATDMAINALRKQIPQKLGSKVLDYLGRARPECGNCGEVIEDAMWDYCPWCGQKTGGE